MCITCGCGSAQPRISAGKSRTRGLEHGDAQGRGHEHADAQGRIYRPVRDGQAHPHGQDHGHDHAHPHLHADSHQQVPGSALEQGETGARLVRLERDVLAKNDAQAMQNRKAFEAGGVLALNLVSSPGSGKTTLLVRTIEALGAAVPVAVIEGDQQTARDAERIRATGAPAVQINTGKGCHLDAEMVARALPALPLAGGTLLFIENVGNLVCPAAFDLGEACKVAVLSVTEGEDKPLKYPDMFRAARLMLLNKCDLLPYLDFDVERAVEYARRVNPAIEVIHVSAKSGEGMEEWLSWLARTRAVRQEAHHV